MTVAPLYPGAAPALDVTIRKDGVEIADGSGGAVGVLSLRQNTYGNWQRSWSAGTRAFDVMYDAFASGEDLGRWGLLFRYPGRDQVIASGPVTTTILAEGSNEGIAADAVSCWGVTDLTHWRERIVFATPTTDVPDGNATGAGGTWPAFTRTKTGHAEDLLLEYLRENLGPAALNRRKLPWANIVIPANRGVGPVVTVSPQANENVLDIAQQLAALAGTSFDMIHTGPNELTVYVRDSVYRGNIIFSTAIGTARGVQIKKQRRSKNEVIASGAGDDATTRYVRRRAAPPVAGIIAPPGGYSEVREEFIKSNGTDAELIVKADSELIEDGGEFGLKVSPDPSCPWRLGEDYHLNDTVAAMVYDQPFELPIREAVIRHESDTLVQQPSVGFDDDESIEPIINSLLARIRRLENRA